MASYNRHTDIVKLLLAQKGTNVNRKCKVCDIPPHCSCIIINSQLFRPFLQQFGRTALYYAASRYYDEIVELLLAHTCVDVNISDEVNSGFDM